MRYFRITVRFFNQTLHYGAIAASAGDAYGDAASAMGDVVCGITVIPV